MPDPRKRQRAARLHIVGTQGLLRVQAENESYYKALVEDICNAISGSKKIERVGATESVSRQVCDVVFHRGRIQSTRNASTKRPLKEEMQHTLAFKYLADIITFDRAPQTEQLLKNTHILLFEGLDHAVCDTPWTLYGDKYRDTVAEPYDREMNVIVNADTPGYTSPLMIPIAMKQTLKALNEEISESENGRDVDPFWLAVKYCVKVMRIHPFMDGNDRISRFILNVILLKYALVVVPLGATEEDRTEYLEIRRRVLTEALGPGELATMVVDKGAICLERIKERVKQVVMENFIAVPQRSEVRKLGSLAQSALTL